MFILVVDDDQEDLELFREALDHIDPSILCIEAYNGLQALKVLQRDSLLPDIIFLDINMPVMGGLECLNKIKTDATFKEIPVIMYSTTSQESQIAACTKLGAQFLTKPSSYSELITSLRKVIDETMSTKPVTVGK
jgi:CheY-like chemotaxis protein